MVTSSKEPNRNEHAQIQCTVNSFRSIWNKQCILYSSKHGTVRNS